MSDKLNISFSVNGAVKQEITILNGEEPEKFFEKMKRFRYLTSISNGDILDIKGGMKLVGTIDEQDITEETEYFDFEMED